MLDRRTLARPDDWYRPGAEATATAETQDSPLKLYVVSYLVTRTVVGLLGIALPLALIVGEAFFLDGSVEVRGSLSAYFHSPMRDVFVACLCVTGVLLMTYMAGMRNTDFWASLVAGAAVVLVAMFPTQRPDVPAGAPSCGSTPEPTGCAAIQQALGEDVSGAIHYTSAAVFLIALMAISYVFGWREKEFKDKPSLARFHYACAALIGASLVLIVLGELLELSFGPLTPLYVGEVVSVLAFGASWLVKGWDIRKALFPPAA